MIQIVSIISVFCGFILMKFPPKNINSIIGYRSPLSMKNQDTWSVAQHYGGSSFIIFGVIIFIFGELSSFLPANIDIYLIQRCLVVIGAISLVFINEFRLKKIFNSDGSRKLTAK